MRIITLFVLAGLTIIGCSGDGVTINPSGLAPADVGDPDQRTGLWSADPQENYQAMKNVAALIPYPVEMNLLDPSRDLSTGAISDPVLSYRDTEITDLPREAAALHQIFTDHGYTVAYTLCFPESVSVFYETADQTHFVAPTMSADLRVDVYPEEIPGVEFPLTWGSKDVLVSQIPDEPGEEDMMPRLEATTGIDPACPFSSTN